MTKEFKKVASNDKFILYAIKINQDTLEVERSYFKNFKYITIWYQDLLFLYAENYRLYVITPRGEKILMPGSFKNFLITPEIQKLRFENPDSYTVSLFLAFHNDVLPTDTDLFITNVANAIYNRDALTHLQKLSNTVTGSYQNVRLVAKQTEDSYGNFTITAGSVASQTFTPNHRGFLAILIRTTESVDKIKVFIVENSDYYALAKEFQNTQYGFLELMNGAYRVKVEVDASSNTSDVVCYVCFRGWAP